MGRTYGTSWRNLISEPRNEFLGFNMTVVPLALVHLTDNYVTTLWL
jgi:hypothetical protein